ncbi:MAG: hypothetical protein HYS86_05005 [Candidatus Chisholmbacteria bacterium]|nr:hypothetical protein [Candidatus Chisholmbacteria bacterium]
MGEQLLRAYSREELVKFDPTLPAFEAALTQVAAQIQAIERQQRKDGVIAQPTVVEPVIPQEHERRPLIQRLGLATQGLAHSLLGFL